MPDLTPEQRELTGAVVAKVHEVDWNGDISPWIPSIISVVSQLVSEDPKFMEFAEAIRNQSAQWALAAWSENIVADLSGSGWSRLSDELRPFASSAE